METFGRITQANWDHDEFPLESAGRNRLARHTPGRPRSAHRRLALARGWLRTANLSPKSHSWRDPPGLARRPERRFAGRHAAAAGALCRVDGSQRHRQHHPRRRLRQDRSQRRGAAVVGVALPRTRTGGRAQRRVHEVVGRGPACNGRAADPTPSAICPSLAAALAGHRSRCRGGRGRPERRRSRLVDTRPVEQFAGRAVWTPYGSLFLPPNQDWVDVAGRQVRGGRIPGAVHLHASRNLAADWTYRQLRPSCELWPRQPASNRSSG